jgi:hypothetical protein
MKWWFWSDVFYAIFIAFCRLGEFLTPKWFPLYHLFHYFPQRERDRLAWRKSMSEYRKLHPAPAPLNPDGSYSQSIAFHDDLDPKRDKRH